MDFGRTDPVSGGKNGPLAAGVRRRRANEKEGKHEGEEVKEHTPLTRTDGRRESEYQSVGGFSVGAAARFVGDLCVRTVGRLFGNRCSRTDPSRNEKVEFKGRKQCVCVREGLLLERK